MRANTYRVAVDPTPDQEVDELRRSMDSLGRYASVASSSTDFKSVSSKQDGRYSR